MKHHLLKSVILSLILVMGVSNAWAKRYYFEVPNIPEWKGANALYAVRLCKGAGINTGTGWERLTQWDENTYYMDFKSTTYTHFQFCRMKDNITSLEGSTWMNLVHTSCYTMPSPIPTDNDEPNLLTVGSRGDDDNSNETQTYSAVWNYQTFTVENVHIIFEARHLFWRYLPTDSQNENELQPVLLIGDNNGSQTIALTKIQNANNIYHCHIQDHVSFTGYTFIQPAEVDIDPNIDDNELPFHERCARIDQVIDTYHQNTTDETSRKTYQEIITNKHEDPDLYDKIVNTTKQRTRSYFEPISGNVFHCIRLNDFIDSKTYFGGIKDLNKTLTIEVKVSYDDGQTYEQTGTLPVDLYSTDQNIYGIKEKIFYFTDSWTNMSQYNTLNLPSGSKTFSYTTPMGYRAKNVYITYNIPQENKEKYEVVKWIMNNTESSNTNKVYSPDYFEEKNPVITLFIKKINNWKCTVNFNTDDLDNITITDQIINPNTTAIPPVIAPELQPVGMICKWYTGEGGSGEEFDFDTHITEDITLYGMWVPEAEEGDYRLLYVEQVVEKSKDSGNEWKTIITRKKAHPSDIIKKGTPSQIVSLHVYKERKYNDANAGNGTTYESSSNPEIILQQYQKVGEVHNWVNIERHMVLGPLETLPGMAMAPGKRNAAANAELVYDDGIEIIKNDSEAGRVWNFTVKQESGVVTLPLDGDNLKPYKGNYYVRTAKAEGGWNNYKISANHMTFSQYAKTNSGFSHYFCKWVDIAQTKNIRFVIANDYGLAISDTLSGDLYTDEYGNISESANIRWSWNEITNAIARAYIQGTWKPGTTTRNNNLVVNYKSYSSAADATALLDDSGDWIYQNNFTVKVGSHLNSLTAQYPVSTGSTQTFAESLDMLTGDEQNTSDYVVRVLYDFKINKTLVTLVPNQNNANIGIDVLIERIDQNKPATQVQTPINAARTSEGSTVYAVLSFTKDHLRDANLSNEEKLTYWISFPFDVTLSDVFGFGEVGQYWMIKYYDGEERAQKGLLDDNTFWKYITKKSTVLEANKGYVLALNKKVMDPNSPIFTNTNKISLYFPSTQLIKEINAGYTQTTCTIPEYISTLKNREIYDSNWNFIGVPSYADKNITTNTTNVKYFYDYNHKTDKYTVTQNVDSKPFNSMFAYMVQFAGIINWESFTFNEGAQGLAARRNTDSDAEQHNLRLELQQNGATADKTFIQLQDEDATEMFDMNSDLCKIINAGSNIYSIISTESTPVNVAGNVLPIQETVIPVGVVISAAGEYTFAMPDGTDGIVVELIDYETNTRTNMLLDEYTINLGKGTFDNRFALHVKPNKVTTSLEDVNTNTTGVKKYLIDGALYMQKDGVLYDAQGKLVR